jgi:hypothetical protein
MYRADKEGKHGKADTEQGYQHNSTRLLIYSLFNDAMLTDKVL